MFTLDQSFQIIRGFLDEENFLSSRGKNCESANTKQQIYGEHCRSICTIYPRNCYRKRNICLQKNIINKENCNDQRKLTNKRGLSRQHASIEFRVLVNC